MGIRTIGQLAACDPRLLKPLLGKQAEEIRDGPGDWTTARWCPTNSGNPWERKIPFLWI